MVKIEKSTFVLGFGCVLVLSLGPAMAALPEWNPVRPHGVEIGPEASRLIVGFKASSANAVIKTVQRRSQAVSVQVTQAKTSAADVQSLVQRTGIAMAGSRQITPSMHVVFLPKTLYGADVNAALQRLRADPSVRFAAVDQRRYPHSMPNDPEFAPNPGTASGQWYMNTPSASTIMVEGVATQDLSATDAVSAWNITTGSSGIVIADVDTGVIFNHPDLLRAGFGGRLLPGYDFVGEDLNPTNSNPLGTFGIANDGDGWDPDPSDPGDWISSADIANPNKLFATDTAAPSSWHGTRVVGVYGAITNNGVGVAGMTWGPWILPVRALGKGGGYDSDILAGVEWAAGLPITNVPDNPYPADIINLSLGGGTDSCSGSAYEGELTTVTTTGALVVISAGNGGNPGQAAPVELPGNCAAVVPGVLAVAGLRNVGTKVGYSSFGPEVSIAAPAGNCINTGTPCLRSIDTTTNLGTMAPGANSYTNEANPNLGTSFSAPIVSGIAALMRSVNFNLTPAQLVTRIKASASKFPEGAVGVPTCPATDPNSGECVCPNDGSQCGAGMINALSAVQAAQRPIVAVAVPAGFTTGSVTLDASGSEAACGATIASYLWANPTGTVQIVSGANAAQVNVATSGSGQGNLTLTVTDSAGKMDTTTLTFTSGGVISSVPASAKTAASACPSPMAVTPIAPVVTEAFAPATVAPNAASTLTITFANNNGFDLTQSALTQSLPANLSIQAMPAVSTTCTGAAMSLTNTTSSVTLTNAIIPAMGSCTITLSVMSTMAGTYTNMIAANALSTGPAGSNTASATAALDVAAPAASSGGGGSSGGGALNWLDIMLVTGVLLAGRRYGRGRPRP